MRPRFYDRQEGGRLLADRLDAHAGQPDLLVLALPRGGVPVAHEVAQGLAAPLDVLVVRKLGVPGHEELAMGAIAGGDVIMLNHDIVRQLGLDDEAIARVAARERRELVRREKAYRQDRPPCPVQGRTVILVDDGIATGATVRAAIAVLRQSGAGRIIVAAPVIARATHPVLCQEADEVAAVILPVDFHSVGEWYEDFAQVTDRQVRSFLDQALPGNSR